MKLWHKAVESQSKGQFVCSFEIEVMLCKLDYASESLLVVSSRERERDRGGAFPSDFSNQTVFCKHCQAVFLITTEGNFCLQTKDIARIEFRKGQREEAFLLTD